MHICVLSKIIIDSISGTQRLGGGGVQAAVGLRLAAADAACTLVAPVGTDFDGASLDCLRDSYAVQTRVEALPHVPTTPGETIWYEGETMRWSNQGWEGWQDLCAWQPALPAADCYHVIVEGGGDGEVRAVQAAMAAATDRPLISIEPVMNDVTAEAVASLAAIAADADVVSPDLRTACQMVAVGSSGSSEIDAAALEGLEEDGGTCSPEAAEEAVAEVVRGCARVLRLRSTATLALRAGARGSYVLAGGNIAHVPAVRLERVVDPTGAGNAYAGALAALLCQGRRPLEAAAVASAVGAAFCGADGWPAAAEAEWVAARASEVETRVL